MTSLSDTSSNWITMQTGFCTKPSRRLKRPNDSTTKYSNKKSRRPCISGTSVFGNENIIVEAPTSAECGKATNSPSVLSSPWSRLSEALPRLPSPVWVGREPTLQLDLRIEREECSAYVGCHDNATSIWEGSVSVDGMSLRAGVASGKVDLLEFVCSSSVNTPDVKAPGPLDRMPSLASLYPRSPSVDDSFSGTLHNDPSNERYMFDSCFVDTHQSCSSSCSADFYNPLLSISPLRLPSQSSPVLDCWLENDELLELLNNSPDCWDVGFAREEFGSECGTNSDSSNGSPTRPPFRQYSPLGSDAYVSDDMEALSLSDNEGEEAISDAPSHSSLATTADTSSSPKNAKQLRQSRSKARRYPPLSKSSNVVPAAFTEMLGDVPPTKQLTDGSNDASIGTRLRLSKKSVGVKSSKISVGCKCKKLRCVNSLCDCVKAKRSCGDTCRCQGCENCGDDTGRLAPATATVANENLMSVKKYPARPTVTPHITKGRSTGAATVAQAPGTTAPAKGAMQARSRTTTNDNTGSYKINEASPLSQERSGQKSTHPTLIPTQNNVGAQQLLRWNIANNPALVGPLWTNMNGCFTTPQCIPGLPLPPVRMPIPPVSNRNVAGSTKSVGQSNLSKGGQIDGGLPSLQGRSRPGEHQAAQRCSNKSELLSGPNQLKTFRLPTFSLSGARSTPAAPSTECVGNV